jgi:hypothetical protein
MRFSFRAASRAFVIACIFSVQAFGMPEPQQSAGDPLTVIALGDAGESGSILRGNGTYLSEMYTGQHDAGKYQALFFLGDNFTPTGLNIPGSSVEKEIASSLGPFKGPMDGLGKDRVHAIPGEHDYYSHNALESSVFFGLIKQQEGPSGISGKGNARAAQIPGWTFHYAMPAQLTLALATASPDSVEFIFFDSALLLRSEPATWRPVLDSLGRMLAAERNRKGILWRILCTHYPLNSVGEHGGYTVWDEDEKAVQYLTPCDRDTNPSGWVRNWLDPEDLCSPRYGQYVDSLIGVLRAGQVSVQAVVSSHDRSLQLLTAGLPGSDCSFCPRIQIISGAGSQTGRVKLPAPPGQFTAAMPLPQDEGFSAPGFVQMRFTQERLRLVFYNAKSGNPIDMGGGQTEFWIDRQGRLLPRE